MTIPTLATTTVGLRRIAEAFSSARNQDRAALMPYFTAGFPEEATCEEILIAIAGAGADLIEVGIPFSDPLADGPVIQRSSQVALEKGMTPAKAIGLVRRLRGRGVMQPVLMMSYVNPIIAYGIHRYSRDAAAAGVDGLIVPDLPLEEASEVEDACREAGLALAHLAAPTSPPERLKRIAERTTGFLYLVSLAGVTGARANLPVDLTNFIDRVRAVAMTPVAVGFGIATPDQVATVARLADGVIVGSALVKAVAQAADPVAAAADFVRSMRDRVAR